MTRWQVLPGTTALWGTSPGAASVMTIMAKSYGADMRLVALMQYGRSCWWRASRRSWRGSFGVNPAHTPARRMVWFPPVDWLALGETLALAVLGPVIARLAQHSGRRFPGADGRRHRAARISASMSIELPTWLLAASYALIGWNIGLRFTRPLLVHAADASCPASWPASSP